MSPGMTAIQTALVKVLDSLLKEVQRTNKLDSSEIDLKNALYTSFERIIRRCAKSATMIRAHSADNQCFFSPNIGHVTPKIVYFHYLKKKTHILCIKVSQKKMETEALLTTSHFVFKTKSNVFEVLSSYLQMFL